MKLVLPYHPHGHLAENYRRGMHWSTYATLLAQERATAYMSLLEALGDRRPHYERIKLTTQWAFKGKRTAKTHDIDSLMAREKVLVDMLTGGSRDYRGLGVVDDDDWEHIVERHMLAPLTGQSVSDAVD